MYNSNWGANDAYNEEALIDFNVIIGNKVSDTTAFVFYLLGLLFVNHFRKAGINDNDILNITISSSVFKKITYKYFGTIIKTATAHECLCEYKDANSFDEYVDVNMIMGNNFINVVFSRVIHNEQQVKDFFINSNEDFFLPVIENKIKYHLNSMIKLYLLRPDLNKAIQQNILKNVCRMYTLLTEK